MGDVLENRYRVREQVGAGSSATIHAATHLVTGRLVAIKWPSHATGVTTLIAQARLAARVHHPAVLQIYEVGCHDGAYFLVMEWVAGVSLATCIRERRLRSEDWLTAFDALLGGIHALHAQGVIHGDLKPANVLLAQDDFGRMTRIKIVDLGSALAQDLSGGHGVPTAGGGSSAYLPPEEAFGSRCLDPRADVYALGVTLRRCLLSLRHPCLSSAKHTRLLAVAEKASASDPDQRFPSALELRLALRHAARRDTSALLTRPAPGGALEHTP